MRGQELLDRLDLVDPAFLEAAEAPARPRPLRRWGTLAACLVLLLGAGVLLRPAGTPQPPEPPVPIPTSAPAPTSAPPPTDAPEPVPPPEAPRIPVEAHYNALDGPLPDAALRADVLSFSRPLTPQEADALLPETRWSWWEPSGQAVFDPEGEVLWVSLTLSGEGHPQPLSLTLGPWDPDACTTPGPETIPTVWRDRTFYLFEAQGTDLTDLSGRSEDGRLRFSVSAPPAELDQARRDLEDLVEALATYPSGQPDAALAALPSGPIPPLRNEALTLEAARQDPDFGAYLPKTTPEGFRLEEARRRLDQHTDTLSVFWSRGYDSLSWTVSPFAPEHLPLLVDPEDLASYDLSRYSIPLYDSVPPEMREVVDFPIFELADLTPEVLQRRVLDHPDAGDGGGPQLSFGVRCGDVLLSIHAKGVDPGWLLSELPQIGP